MPPAKKKEKQISPMEMLQGILHEKQYLFNEGEDNDIIWAEKPVDIITFVTSKEWLGIAPQIDPDTREAAPSPLSAGQLDFLEKATDFENGITDFVLWVG